MNVEHLIKNLSESASGDPELFKLLEKAREYARVYHFAKARQKGCNGMGEVATLKDEFNSVIEDLLSYASEKGYIPPDTSFDIDEVAKVLIY